MTVRANVEGNVLRWARESVSLSPEEAARKVQVSPERLADWENDQIDPTIRQLRKLANVYKRPINLLFLPVPPEDDGPKIHDFRHLPGTHPGHTSYDLQLQLRRSKERREIALELIAELGEDLPEFGLAAGLEDDPEELGNRIRDFLLVEMNEQRQWRDQYDALNGWRGKVEAAGALVFQMSGVALKEARGASIAELPLPIVLFNSKDTPRGRVFTMLHELVHIALRRSGLCEPDEDRARPPEEQRVEVFCNRVAGAALLPMNILTEDRIVRTHRGEWSDEELTQLSRNFGVSRFVFLRRLQIAGLVTNAFYRQKHIEWVEELAARPNTGFSLPDRSSLSQNGRPFTKLVLQGYYNDFLSLGDVSRHLKVRLKHLPNIEKALAD